MLNIRNRKTTLLFAAAAGVFVALAIAGAVNWYSPVPFWDSWQGYLNFYAHATSWHSWWAAHNEHRILIPRVLFWMDLTWFHGTGLFLIIVNYLLQGLTCLIFWLIWRQSAGAKLHYLGYFLVSWLFFWSQRENLVWGFQSTFFLAQLLPLAAFWVLYLASSRQRHNTLLFAAAALLGVLSIGTMANALLTLPLMTLFSLLARMRRRQSLLLAALSVATIWFYLLDYHVPHRHSTLAGSLANHPIGLLHFILLYTGNPFYYLFGQNPNGRLAATIAGFFLIASSAAFAWRILLHERHARLPLALLMFLLYIGASVIATAGARLELGTDYALSSRYTTPVLMAWATLLILYAPIIVNADRRIHGQSWILFALLLLAMLPQQLLALDSHHDRMFHRKIGALAVELGARDQHEVLGICWSARDAIALSRVARERGLSIFGLPPYKGAREAIDSDYAGVAPVSGCHGHLDAVLPITDETRFIRAYGWFYEPQNHSVPPSLQFVDSHDIVRGVALTGKRRKDIEKDQGSNARYSGFIGYLTKTAEGKPITIIDPQSGCAVSARVPVTFFSSAPAKLKPGSVSVSADRVGTGNTWTGGDRWHSQAAGLTILASFVHADSDTGSIRLAMKRGDTLLYRSGPNVDHQTISVVGNPGLSGRLPPAPDWVQLKFSSDRLPETFILQLTDNGTHGGEWSELALKKTDN